MATAVPPRLFGWQVDRQGPSAEEVKAATSAEEWSLVVERENPVKRVRVLLKIAADRLQRTQGLAAREDFSGAATLLQQYTTIISYTIAFIESLPDKRRKKRRNAFKEFDVRIRKQIPTLKNLKRTFPVGISEVSDALLTAERLRIIALNGFSGAKIIKVPPERP